MKLHELIMLIDEYKDLKKKEALTNEKWHQAEKDRSTFNRSSTRVKFYKDALDNITERLSILRNTEI